VGWACPREDRGGGASEMVAHCGGVGRDPGARVVAAGWPQERSGNGPGDAVRAMASIVMAGAAHDVRGGESPGGT
jgi:hypothetical protein